MSTQDPSAVYKISLPQRFCDYVEGMSIIQQPDECGEDAEMIALAEKIAYAKGKRVVEIPDWAAGWVADWADLLAMSPDNHYEARAGRDVVARLRAAGWRDTA